MSRKNNGGDFQNLAARKFKRLEKVDTMAQGEIFDILSTDISTILSQITNYRENHGKFPQYLPNAFANLSTVLWFHLYVKEHCKVKKGKLKTDLSKDEVKSLLFILADVYKKSAINFYAQQTQEFVRRNELLSKTFKKLAPDQYKLAKKFGLSKSKTRELIIQIYGDPVSNMRFVYKLIDQADPTLSNKKKIKLLKKLYGKRFIKAVGAAMTVSKNDSDTLQLLFEYFSKKKAKKRAKFILAYAEAYKENKSYNFRMSEPKFYKKNKDIFKELVDLDIGFEKSVTKLGDRAKEAREPKENKDKPKDKSRKF